MHNIKQKINKIAKAETRYVIASLMNKLRDLQLCEDSFQDAIIAAMMTWPKNGIPSSPRAWLITTAHRKALDFLKRGQNFRSKTVLIQYETQLNADENLLKWNDTVDSHTNGFMPSPHLLNPNEVDDEQLKLIYLCCHPALNQQAQVALSLKIIGGLSTEEIAAAYLTSETTMAQRLVRAKKKIKQAGIAFKLPDSELLSDRIDTILSTIYLIYNESYLATNSAHLVKVSLADEAIGLCRNVIYFMPESAESKGLLALMLLQIARVNTRLDGDGNYVPLEFQDRRLWCNDKIIEGKTIIVGALKLGELGKYQLLAAINSCHADAAKFADTDWRQIELLYVKLYEFEPSPIVALNIIVARTMHDKTDMQLQHSMYHQLLDLETLLINYQPYFAVKADFLIRLKQVDDAKIALEKAIKLTNNQIEIKYLNQKLLNLD